MSDQSKQALMEEHRDLYNKVDLAFEIKQFWQGRLGQLILARIEADREEAVRKLLEVSPINSSEIMRLQSEIMRLDSIPSWLGQFLEEGKEAVATLRGMDVAGAEDDLE